MWYAVSLFFKGLHTPPGKMEPKWEESIRLVEASSEEEARDKAQKIGCSEEVSYKTQDGSLTWKFERVERIYAIDEAKITDGTEVFSRFLRETEALSLLTPFDDE